MADRMKDQDNKDAQESGRPVQLDREEEQRQGGKPGQQQGGQHDKQHDKHQDKPGLGQKPGQSGQEHQNR
jgi:hypothetical protein